MRDLNITALLIAATLGILLPVCIIYMRQSVKFLRQQLIKDLEHVFHRKSQGEGRDQVIPSFEFVKFKYFLDSNAAIRNEEHDIPSYVILLASVPLMICLCVIGYFSISTVLSLAINEERLGYFKLVPPLQAWSAALIIAYVGAYLFTVRDLLCSVENFDLGPARLLASALHVLFGTATAVLITVVWTSFLGPKEIQLTNIPIFVTAFAVGYVPELGIRALLRASKLRLFKHEDYQVYNTFRSVPLEIIDGIDSEIRSRLREYNITTVQHLATANPVMLFVETPYGIYQIFDWVAQAQLCCAVGTQGFTALGKIGIRTIFDLERAVLDSKISTPAMRQEIGRRMVTGLGAERQQPINLIAKEIADESNVIGMVEVLVDDLHIQRLRQIYNCITDRLGSENRRLKFAWPRKRKAQFETEITEDSSPTPSRTELAVVQAPEPRTAGIRELKTGTTR